jgi:hypothetical protein
VVVRAVERGELAPGTDPAEVFKALAAPIHFRLLVTGEPLDEHAADQAVRLVLAAARAGVLTTPPRATPDEVNIVADRLR